ncbi:MAG: XTP/dITP diphosphatase [Thermoplasmata archaeon]|nr:MAG: XTP/dITP diphosphatase [Thermoplasmata archaeon]
MKKIQFGTSNPGKLLETQKLFAPLGFEIEQVHISYPELQSSDLEEVASFGINWIMKEKKIEEAVIIEDAGLFVSALNNYPGVFSKHFFVTIGFDGILRLLKGKEDRSAYFESCVAYCEKGSEPLFFKGRVDGTIAIMPRGHHGFGYDPIFIPKGAEKTFAEMEIEEKNKHSHRAIALRQLAEFLSNK